MPHVLYSNYTVQGAVVMLKGAAEELSEGVKDKGMKIKVNASGKFPAVVNLPSVYRL